MNMTMFAALRGLRTIRVECDRCDHSTTARRRHLRDAEDCIVDGVAWLRCTAWSKEWTA